MGKRSLTGSLRRAGAPARGPSTTEAKDMTPLVEDRDRLPTRKEEGPRRILVGPEAFAAGGGGGEDFRRGWTGPRRLGHPWT